jgi:hypothetical protein
MLIRKKKIDQMRLESVQERKRNYGRTRIMEAKRGQRNGKLANGRRKLAAVVLYGEWVRFNSKQALLLLHRRSGISRGPALRPVEDINPNLNLAVPFSTN